MERLTIEEQQRFWKAVDGFEETQKKLSEMYVVIVGNEKFGQEGMVQRLNRLETQFELMEKEITKAKGWIAGVAAASAVFGSGMTLFIKAIFKL
jgi:hypothetical protein